MAAQLQPIKFGPDDALPGFETGVRTAPSVVLLQEWWGVTPQHRFTAELLAAQGGFRVLIPDLYKGKLGVTREEAHHLRSNLDFRVAVDEIGHAVAYLQATGSPKVGITGFCMGGALSLAAGQHVPALAAIVSNYGVPDPEQFDISVIKAPTLLITGENDKSKGFSDPATVEGAAAKIKSGGGDVAVKVVPTGVHGFFNQLAPDGEEVVKARQGAITDPSQVQEAWATLLAFFKQHLAPV